MRILLLSQFFGPDSAASGQLLGDAARAAAEAGHKVQVICGRSNYAGTETGYAAKILGGDLTFARPDGRRPGDAAVDVARVGISSFSHTKAKKLLSFGAFVAGAVWKALRRPRPDVVLTLPVPPGLAWIGWLLQRIYGCRHIVWVMDVYPDIAVALDMHVVGWFRWFLDYPLRKADSVIALGDCMKERLLRHGISKERIRIVENWADGRNTYPLPFPGQPPLRVLYSGNLGLAHDLATVQAAMEQLANDPNFHFDFAGGGPQRKELCEFCQRKGIDNVSFRPYVPYARLGASLSEGHIGLVTQKPATLGAVVPSKTYGLMAAGRPVLYIGPAAATPARVVRRFDCGWQVECGDVDRVVGLLRHLVKHPEEILEKGERGRKAFLEHCDLPLGVARICQVMGIEGPAQRAIADQSQPIASSI